MAKGISEELSKPLSFGTVFGGFSPSTARWEQGIKDLSSRVRDHVERLSSPLKVNVVFHVPGDILHPEFKGVRTATFSRSKTSLMIQVALPEEAPQDVDAYLYDALAQAIDAAERWARRHKVAESLTALRDLLAQLGEGDELT